MEKYNEILNKLRAEYENNTYSCMIVTGSVARGEAKEGNDIDILLISNNETFSKEYREGKCLVEISSNTLESYLSSLEKNPMQVYMYLDAKAIFDNDNSLPQLQEKANKILNSYRPTEKELQELIKWTSSVMDKITVAQDNSDNLKVGFHVSNVLWKVVEGLYAINSMPTPASTSALRRIDTLVIVPPDFERLWKQALLGDLEERTDATLELIRFILNKLEKL
jgi:predicted nucleotidyltransferase